MKQTLQNCRHEERIDYGESQGAYKTIGDEEHVQIISDYFEGLNG